MCQEPFLDKIGKLQALWCLELLLSLLEGRSVYKPTQTDRNESFCSQHPLLGAPNGGLQEKNCKKKKNSEIIPHSSVLPPIPGLSSSF